MSHFAIVKTTLPQNGCLLKGERPPAKPQNLLGLLLSRQPASLFPVPPPSLLAPTPTRMTSQIPTSKLHITPRTPERRRPVKGASLVAASTVEDDLKTWIARFQGEVIPPTTVQALPRKASQKRANNSKSSPPTVPVQQSGTILLLEYPVFRTAYVLLTSGLLDEEVELCWPLSIENSGPPGPELDDFKIFHHRLWKMFESAEDLMTDEYLEACFSTVQLARFWKLTIVNRYSADVIVTPSAACSASIYSITRIPRPRAKYGML